MSSSLLRELREEDAEQVAALFVRGVRRGAEARRATRSRRGCATRTSAASYLRVLEEDGAHRRVRRHLRRAATSSVRRPRRTGSLGRAARLGRRRRPRRVGLQTRPASSSPHEHELARIAAARGYDEAPRVVDDGDRASTSRRAAATSAASSCARTATTITSTLIARAQRCVLRGPVLRRQSRRRAFRESILRRATSIRRSGFSPGTATSSRASRSTIRSSGPTPTSATSTGSASASRGAAAGSPKRCSAQSFGELVRARQAPDGLGVDAENVDRCVAGVRARRHARDRIASAPGRRTCERAPRALPRLPHADRGRDRPRVPVPRLRPRVRGRPRARADGVGRRRRGDGRRGAHGAAVARGGGRRRGDARRRDRTDRRASFPRDRSSSAAAAARHVGAVRELARATADRRRLDRRTRRPEHARVVAVRQRVGDAAADADRRRRRRCRGRDPARRPQPRPARGRVHRRGRDPAGARARSRTTSTSRSIST